MTGLCYHDNVIIVSLQGQGTITGSTDQADFAMTRFQIYWRVLEIRAMFGATIGISRPSQSDIQYSRGSRSRVIAKSAEFGEPVFTAEQKKGSATISLGLTIAPWAHLYHHFVTLSL
jgi:hypothetical protein